MAVEKEASSKVREILENAVRQGNMEQFLAGMAVVEAREMGNSTFGRGVEGQLQLIGDHDGELCLLEIAVQENRVEMCELLLKRFGQNPNQTSPTKGGWTPLMTAIREQHYECFRLLCHHHATDLGAENELGLTALHIAAMRNQVYCLELLVDAGAQVMGDNGKGDQRIFYTPLHVAALMGHRASVLFLMEGLPPLVNLLDHPNQDYNTALHLAAIEGELEVVKILLDYQANSFALNAQEKTPLDLCSFNRHPKCHNILREGQSRQQDRDDACNSILMLSMILFRDCQNSRSAVGEIDTQKGRLPVEILLLIAKFMALDALDQDEFMRLTRVVFSDVMRNNFIDTIPKACPMTARNILDACKKLHCTF